MCRNSSLYLPQGRRRYVKANTDCAVIAMVKGIVGVVEVRFSLARVTFQTGVHMRSPVVHFPHCLRKEEEQ